MSPLTATCMFVDRAGCRPRSRALRDLAQEILAGRAKVIPRPKHPFIDRALVSIRKMLAGADKVGPVAPEANHDLMALSVQALPPHGLAPRPMSR
jgi:hypothetical protein